MIFYRPNIGKYNFIECNAIFKFIHLQKKKKKCVLILSAQIKFN